MSANKLVPDMPLAERMRPLETAAFYGQEHLLGEGKPLRVMIDNDAVSSFILWGPPGTGKTTIASIIAARTGSDFHRLNAVSSGVKDVRAVIQQAELRRSEGKKTIVFIDEIHRFNKSQQDALLHAVESGVITLLGATTENPSFEVIPALRSRMRTYILQPLSAEHLKSIVHRAITTDRVLKEYDIVVEEIDYLLYLSGGDARVLLNLLEAAFLQEKLSARDKKISITKNTLDTIIQQKNIFYDKLGEEHYNIISAFIKSIRGSDPDAALYWMARMLEGGEDPLFIARRMIILASEDIGNASPNALVLATAAFSAVEKIGMPEGRIVLSQCAAYLASSPKSNASYIAIEKAFEDVRTKPLFPVPVHLRNAPTTFMKKIGYGKDYKYPHEYPHHFIEENYFPEEMKGTQYYFPTELGQEKTLKERLQFFWGKRKKYDKS